MSGVEKVLSVESLSHKHSENLHLSKPHFPIVLQISLLSACTQPRKYVSQPASQAPPLLSKAKSPEGILRVRVCLEDLLLRQLTTWLLVRALSPWLLSGGFRSLPHGVSIGQQLINSFRAHIVGDK